MRLAGLLRTISVVMALPLAACSVSSSVRPPPPTTAASTRLAGATTTTTPPSTVVALPECRASQLHGILEGVQGATGNWAAGFWIADTSADACALWSPVRLDLIDPAGQVRLSATTSFSTIDLSARSPFPPQNPPSGHMAYVSFLWPTDGSFAAGACPTADFVPQAARMVFDDSTAITVSNQSADGRDIAICGSHIDDLVAGPLGP